MSSITITDLNLESTELMTLSLEEQQMIAGGGFFKFLKKVFKIVKTGVKIISAVANAID
jgi:hypothetical protein